MKSNKKVIVSLTSFPAAIGFVPAAVRSILEGSVQPDKIVLYLTASQFPVGVVPDEIEELKAACRYFEVRFWDENIRSYTKLVPALHDFPDDVIITIDDDTRYAPKMVEKLLRFHKKHPGTIIAHNVRRIMLDIKGNLRPYMRWKRYKPRHYLERWPRAGFHNLLFGVGGVLYPPHSLDPGMLDSKLFMSMAPTVDDVWFWAAAVAKGTKILPAPFGYWTTDELGKPAELSLRTTNTLSEIDVNRDVLLEILRRYPVVRERLEESAGRSVNL